VAPEVDALVVGGGVVGLAAGAALARKGRSVVVLERHDAIARETTSRNSEVIHAGLYYPEGSLKALCCVEGREAVYARCAERRIPHRPLGKIVVATAQPELPRLEALAAQAERNGVPGLRWLGAAEIRAREPHVAAIASWWGSSARATATAPRRGARPASAPRSTPRPS
jgi:L-2-hydroxyglutarate oxidase LhgO